MKIEIEITPTDIEQTRHGNADDPLVHALNRTTNKSWRSEVYSAGRRMEFGSVWSPEDGQEFLIDQATTKALQDFDRPGAVFDPRIAVLS